MEIKFYKYQGTGNDFIMINNMNKELSFTKSTISRLCDRKFGIGADGLILIEPDVNTDFYVNYYNSDGSQSFCGNGSRCSVAFAHSEDIFRGPTCTFNAIDGLHTGEILPNLEVQVSMGDVNGLEKSNNDFVLNTGSPHYVVFCNALTDLDLISEAKKIRYHSRFFDEGINVNFVERIGNALKIRTYERGVEDETLSCGTGVTAAAVSSVLDDGTHNVKLETLGGELRVSFIKKNHIFSSIKLQGAANFVFFGEVKLEK